MKTHPVCFRQLVLPILGLAACAGLATLPAARAQNAPPQLVDDTVTISNSTATLFPLANDVDPEGDQLSLTGVSAASVTISGRQLTIPAGFTGSFTYQASDGFNTSSATVTVLQSAAVANARRFNGLLYNGEGGLAGRVKMLITRRGTTSLELYVGTRRTAGVFVFGSKGGQAVTPQGTLVLAPNPDGTVKATLGALIGLLRPGPTIATPELQHLSLSSIGNLNVQQQQQQSVQGIAPPAIPRITGGGYMIVRQRRDGTAILSGRLPDGCPYTSGSSISDIKSIAFYTAENTGSNNRGFVGGELLKADLPLTDITGELVWMKPAQGAFSKYQYRSGVNTILQANGSIFRATNLTGRAILQLEGGNLNADESSVVNANSGRPGLAGSLAGWVLRPGGTFVTRIRAPFSHDPLIGGGVYLPKSQSAWGYFNGQTEGGRIQLRLDNQAE